MKLHLFHAKGSFRHLCSLETHRTSETYLSLWVNSERLVCIPTTHYMSHDLMLPVEHLGTLKYGGEDVEPCRDCLTGLEKLEGAG